MRDGISEEFREHVFGKSNGFMVGDYSLFLFPFISEYNNSQSPLARISIFRAKEKL